MADVVVSAKRLKKVFYVGFFRRPVQAVVDVSFDVHRNEIFGFLGPNGAGKTTTIKMLMGLIFPTSGEGYILGRPVRDREAKRKLGFLPESPYFYDYLSGAELLDLMGRIFGLDARDRKKRTEALLDRVGLGRVAPDLPLRKYSKGMLQRLGIAQALINDPELVVLDEPMSGLDPIGRKEVRDIISELRREGRTVMFSTHILSDAEMLCDRIAMVVGGTMHGEGALDTVLTPKVLGTEIVFARDGKNDMQRIPADADLNAALQALMASGATILSVTPRKESLEELFMDKVAEGDTGGGAAMTKKKTAS